MATTRTSNIFAIEVLATSSLSFAMIPNQQIVAGSTASSFSVAVTQGVPAATLAGNINVSQFSNSDGSTTLPGADSHAGIVTAAAVDNTEVSVTLDPSSLTNSDAKTTFAQLSTSQPDAGD